MIRPKISSKCWIGTRLQQLYCQTIGVAMRVISVRFLLVGLYLAFSLAVHAQDSGRIVGIVTDASGAMAPGVAVRVLNTQTNAAAKYVTNEQGRFIADNLSPGSYMVEADAQGFKHF